MKLTWRQMEAFRATMQLGTVTHAAESLSISQPAVSILLANLESELGYKLFLRQQGRLVPTGEAEALYPEIERAFVGLEDISLAARAIGQMQAGVLRIVTMPLFARALLSDVVAGFALAHPNVSVVYEVQARLTILNWIATNRCDLGISTEPTDHPGIQSRALSSGEVVCILPPGHALASEPFITPAHLDGQNLISLPAEARSRRQLDRLLEDSRSHPVRRVETRTSQAVWQLVERGVGIGVISQFPLSGPQAENVVVRPFRPEFASEVLLLHARYRPLSRLASAFCEHIDSYLEKMGAAVAKPASFA